MKITCRACGYEYNDEDPAKNIKELFIRTSNKIYVDNTANPYQLYICPKCGNVIANME